MKQKGKHLRARRLTDTVSKSEIYVENTQAAAPAERVSTFGTYEVQRTAGTAQDFPQIGQADAPHSEKT